MAGKVKRAIIEGDLFEKIYQKIKRFFINVWNGKYRRWMFKLVDFGIAAVARQRLAKTTAIEKNKILFITTRGSYNCNNKAIVDEILRQKLPWQLVWVVREENLVQTEQYPEKLKLVVRGSYEFYKEMASAKVWIDNSVNLSYLYLPKKPGQVLMEIWHGSFGLKRFETSSDRVWIRKAKQAGARTDFCVSNSEFEKQLLKKTFWQTAEMLPYGHPRNDVLAAPDTERAAKIAQEMRKRLRIASDIKVALYAPTFRDGESLGFYNIDYCQLRDALAQRFGGEWVILTRFHFGVRNQISESEIVFPPFVTDVTGYQDIQDIMCITDVGITDYSSWICDFVLTKKPGFLFAPDLKAFNNERGFCYSLESTPFPLAQGNQGLVANILDFDEALYRKKCGEYLEKMGCLEDGYAAERVVKKLREIMEA